MFWQRLSAFGTTAAELARPAGAALLAALMFAAGVLRWFFLDWLPRFLRACWETFIWALRGIFVPKAAGPLDVLKHYLLVFFMGMAVLTLFWAGYQVRHPPLVVTVMDLPQQLKDESWINPELTRALISEIERMRALVKGDRDPAFEAVLNPPNVVIKTGEFSLDVQQQILTPLGTLLGFGQGEVRLAVTCYHPGCPRTSDDECRDLIPAPKSGDSASAERQFLCLRLTADIQRGRQYRRLTPRIVLTNDTYELNLQRPMSRVAEAVTSIADPATAALYFYRRVKQESDAARSLTNDPELIADLRSEGFRAAEAADTHDTAAKCWAHTVRAHFAIDRREFSLAEVYLGRASALNFLDHVRDRVWPGDCQRLIDIAEMELARRLARRGPFPAYPEHPDDYDSQRITAAHGRIERLLAGRNKSAGTMFGFMRDAFSDDDLRSALELARSEIGLGWFTRDDQCLLLQERAAPLELEPDLASGRVALEYEADERLYRIRLAAWQSIQQSIGKLRALSQHTALPPLTLQAAMDFLEQFAGNERCIDRVQPVMRQVYLAHPSSAKVTQTFAGVTEAAAMKSRNLKGPATADDRGNVMLGYARSTYERLVDIGGHNTDVVALSRLAYITEAFFADAGEDRKPRYGPQRDTLAAVTLGWKRYEQQYYPSATRHHAEFLTAFWSSLLYRFYPDLLDADLSPGAKNQDIADKEQLRSAVAAFAELRSALRFFVPTEKVTRLADLPNLSNFGTRISCLCMLSHAVYQNELADFLVDRINKWQTSSTWLNAPPDFDECGNDFISQKEEDLFKTTREAEVQAKRAFERVEADLKAATGEAVEDARERLRKFEALAAKALADAEAALATANEKTPELERAVREAKNEFAGDRRVAARSLRSAEARFKEFEPKKEELEKALEVARESYFEAQRVASDPRESWRLKNRNLDRGAELCRFTAWRPRNISD